MEYPLAFIHIGLPKCASTFVQTVWHKDPVYNLIVPDQVVELALGAATRTNGAAPTISVSPELLRREGMVSVGSSEGFTWGFINQPEKQGCLADLHRSSAGILGRAQLSDTILILVRNPMDWIRSLHVQSIKEGGTEPFEVFKETQRGLILGPLNLEQILTQYGRYFPRIVILATEELRRDPDSFWAGYSRELNLPQPAPLALRETAQGAGRNKSLGERTFDLALMNRYSQGLMEVLGDLPGYRRDHQDEFTEFRDVFKNNWTWLNRRIAEYATDEQMAGLTGRFHQDGRGEFQRIKLDRKLVREIQGIYLGPLERFGLIGPGLLEEYQTSLEEAVRG